ncbi:beta-N-acetylhexosaminidase [Butyrivibrio sp. XPD2002]|uniref:beta-N-acetylhexosaminidase n=1 Tax=Butyrivibrio sp. XPD2002 TaxID=1280665 RepID=UPI0004267A4D|nr:beta-N-acetylhexosaminidase [Butyrivibrio sp. XPD2002]
MSIQRLRELGVMIDCSRNAVVKLSALKDFIKICADFGYDYVGLYTEDTFEVTDEPYFGYQRGRYTQAEIREADEYAKSLGLELRPYIQTLAHINQIVDYADYIDHIDLEDILLAGDPRTERLLEHILSTVSKTYSTRKVNIGMDEAHMVGLGKYLDLHGYQNRVEILLQHLDMVVKLCKKHGLQPQMWSDMFFRLLSQGGYGAEDEESAKKLTESFAKEVKIPEGLELVYWDYYSTAPDHYKRILAQHKVMTDNISFAGGAWRWMGFTPYNDYSIHATQAAINACLEMDVDSCVMTMWGDDGTECSMYAVLPVLYEAARLGGKLPDKGAPEELFENVTGYTTEDFMLLDIANPGSRGEKRNQLSKILLFNDPLLGIYDSLVPDAVSDYYNRAADKLFAVMKNGSRRFDQVFEMQAQLCSVLSLKADLGIRLRDAYQNRKTDTLTDICNNVIPELIKRLDAFYEAFKSQWMLENKSFGFEVQTIRIGGLKQRLIDIQSYLEDYLSGKLQTIEELETKALPVGYALHGESIDSPEYNRYQKLATTSRLTW